MDIHIAEKMSSFLLLGQWMDGHPLQFSREFMSTDDHYRFNEDAQGFIVYEGKMFEQFNSVFETPRWWITIDELKKTHFYDSGDWQHYRFAIRRVASSTNERTVVATILPKKCVVVHSIYVNVKDILPSVESLYLVAFLNSFVVDFSIRCQVASNISQFFIHQLPIPRLTESNRYFNEIVERAAKLICTTPEFDELAAEVGLGSHENGVTDETERAELRAELDGMIAHLYGLTEDEFKHILSTFAVVPEETKEAALEAYKTFTPLTGDPEIINLITQGENAQLEFKSSTHWDIRENKQNKVMEEVILKTVAGFLNSYQGGTLLIGIDDDGNVLGLNHDYQTFKKKNRDGYELFLTNDLLLKELGKDLAPYIHITFHEVEGKDVCRIILDPSPRPVYVKLKDSKSGQTKECFFIRTGNLTREINRSRLNLRLSWTRLI